MVGASGRVGRMVLSHSIKLAGETEIVPQYRNANPPDGLAWDLLKGTQPLLDAVAQYGGFDAMVMLAGVTPGPGKSLELNRILAEASLSAAQEAGIPRVLLASSSAVYGLGDGTPFTEYMVCNPVTDYGSVKLGMEQSCASWRNQGIDLCCLRIGNVAGADALLMNVAKSSPGQRIELDIFADGHGPLRSYIGPRTLASVLKRLCLIDGPLPPALNVAAPVPIFMDALADAADQRWVGRDASGQRHQHITLNCDALSEFYTFDKSDSDPKTMVKQWKDTLEYDA